MENLLLLLIILGGIYLLFRSFKKRPLSELSKEQQKFVKIGENVVDTFQTGYSKVKKNAEKKISTTYLIGNNWYLQTNENDDIIYTFRRNKELLITTNGIVKKKNYEFIVDNNSIIISDDINSEMFFIENLKDNCLFLFKISNKETLVFSNQTKFKDALKTHLNTFQKEQDQEVRHKFRQSEFDIDKYMERTSLASIRARNYDSYYDYIRKITDDYDKSDLQIIEEMNLWLENNHNSLIGMNQINTIFDYIVMLEYKNNIG